MTSKPSSQAQQFLKYVQMWNRRKYDDVATDLVLPYVETGAVCMACPATNGGHVIVDPETLVRDLTDTVSKTNDDEDWSTLITHASGFEDASVEQYSPVGYSSGPLETIRHNIAIKTEASKTVRMATTNLVVATHKDTGEPHASLLVTAFYVKSSRKGTTDKVGTYAYPGVFYGMAVAAARDSPGCKVQDNFERLRKHGVAIQLQGKDEELLDLIGLISTVHLLHANFVSKEKDIFSEKHIKHWSDQAKATWCEQFPPDNIPIDWSVMWNYVFPSSKPSKRPAPPSPASSPPPPPPSPPRDRTVLRQQERPAKRTRVEETEAAAMEIEEDTDDVVRATEVIHEKAVPSVGDIHVAFVRSNARFIRKNNLVLPSKVMAAVRTGDLRQVIQAIHTHQSQLDHAAAEFADRFMRVTKCVFNITPYSLPSAL